MTYLRKRGVLARGLYYKFRWYLKLGFGNTHIDLALGRKILFLAYLDNLLRALIMGIRRLLANIKEAHVIITSDHGELLGERGLYGHRTGLHVRELVEVPWLELRL